MRRQGWTAAVVVAIAFLYLACPSARAQESAQEPADSPVQAVQQMEGEEAPPEAPAPGAAEEKDRELTVGEAFVLKLRQGGLTMVFLLLLSVAGLGYALERFVHLRSKAIVPPGLAERADKLWREGRYEEIENLPERHPSTLARVLAVIARHRDRSMVDVSMLSSDVASRELRRHVLKAYPLAVVYTAAPLLGLLGTVIGMIGAFDKVAAAGSLGDASLLGGDISKALITTGAGLTIAVPALILYHYFKSRTNLYAVMLEEEVGELLKSWFAVDEPDAAAESTDED
jgi:biopolymer transport protein ExbB